MLTDLAEAVCARLCHDLAGPIGTLAAALEMAAEDEAEALAIAGEEASRVAARLRYLRAAWAGGAGAMDGQGLAALAAGLPGGERLTCDLSAVQGVLPEALARLVLCALPVALLAQPRGGELRGRGDGHGVTLSLTQGEWPAMQATPPEPRGVPVLLLHAIAARSGYAVDVSAGQLRLAPAPDQATRR